MIPLHQLCVFLESLAPPHLAEDWDNVGLLVGDPQQPIRRVMTCLTVTPASADEAVQERADAIVTHHPLPFRALKRLTSDSTPSRLLLQLIAAGIAVYSPHTAFDSAAAGVNQQLALAMGLTGILPLIPREQDPQGPGAGRYGRLPSPATLEHLVQRLKDFLSLGGMHVVGDPQRPVQRVAVACGAAGEMLGPAIRAGCDALVTGETNFHTCLEAEASGIGLLLPGHYASERFAMETLSRQLAEHFPELAVWPSRRECDPLRWV
jgi:dinuclear metal center YbgI/SA1388 family protein